LISGGFQAPAGSEPPLERKKLSPPGQIPEYTPLRRYRGGALGAKPHFGEVITIIFKGRFSLHTG